MSDVDEVYMNVPEVRNIAKMFNTMSEVLTTIGDALETLSETLKHTAFIGLVGGAVAILVIDTIRPRVDELAEQCGEISRDVDASATAFENGDQQGATRFY